MSVFVEHDVLGLQVAVEDPVLVESLNPQKNLAGVVANKLLLKLFAFF